MSVSPCRLAVFPPSLQVRVWSNVEEVVLRGPPAIGRSALERKAFAPLVCTHVCVLALGVSSDYEIYPAEGGGVYSP